MPTLDFFDESKTQYVVPHGGATASYKRKVLPKTQITGSDATLVPANLEFDVQLSPEEYVDFSKSYVACQIKVQMSDGAGGFNAVQVTDDIALAQFAPAFAFSNFQTQINGQQMEMQAVNNPAQSSSLYYLATRSREYLETNESAACGQASFADRRDLITGDQAPEIHWMPGSAIWGYERGIRPGHLRLTAGIDTNWATRMVESETVTLVPGGGVASTGYRITIEQWELRLETYKKIKTDKAGKVIPPSTKPKRLQLRQLYVHPKTVTAITTVADQVTLPHPAYYAWLVHQVSGSGTTTTKPLNEFSNAAITSAQITFQGVNVPLRADRANFALGRGQETYKRYLEATYDWAAGSALDYKRWEQVQTVMAFPLVATAGSPADRFDYDISYASAFTGTFYFVTVHDSIVEIRYNSDGLAKEAVAFRTPAEMDRAAKLTSE